MVGVPHPRVGGTPALMVGSARYAALSSGGGTQSQGGGTQARP